MSVSFVEDISLVDKDLSHPLLDVICSTLIICSTLCLRTAGCFGFSFKEATGACRLHDSFLSTATVKGNRVWKAVKCPQAEPRPGVYCLPSCYCVMPIHLKITWDGANTDCAFNGSSLAKVDTRERLDFILSVMTLEGMLNMWTGGYKSTTSQTWQWSDGTLIDTGLMKIGGIGNCVNVWKDERSLDDAVCNHLVHFGCQKGTV